MSAMNAFLHKKGKTHTMVGNAKQPGVMVQAISDLFSLVGQETDPDVKHKVQVSYIEIYNECLRDLLVPDTPDLELREDAEGNSVVCGVQRKEIETSAEMMDLLKDGNRRRTQEATFANRASSRSHAVLEVTVDRWSTVPGTTTAVQSGRLFMIDLAGSERAQASGNNGQRMVEGQHINRSLLALGNCINALGGGQKSSYVNYRDSKLTRMLKDSLCGNCRTVMIACASPASNHFEETYNTMNYANRAKNIKTKVAKNITVVEAHVAQYVEMIAGLREQVTSLKDQLGAEGLALAPPGSMLALPSHTGALFDRIDVVLEQQRITRTHLAKVGASVAEGAKEPLEVVQQRTELEAQLTQQTTSVKRLLSQVSAPEDQRMLKLIGRNWALETQIFDLRNSLVGDHSSRKSLTRNRSIGNNHDDTADGLALRDRIIESQRLQLKRLGKRKALPPPDLVQMYKELELLRLAERASTMPALPGMPSIFGERTRPVVGGGAVVPPTAHEGGEHQHTMNEAPAPAPPTSGGKGVLGMFGGGKKREPQQQQLSPPPSSRRRSHSPAAHLPTALQATLDYSLPSSSPPPSTPGAETQASSSSTVARILPRPRSSSVFEVAPESSGDLDSASEISSDAEGIATGLEAWSNDGRSLAGSLSEPLSPAHIVTRLARSASTPTNDLLNNTYTKTNPMPMPSNVELVAAAAAPTRQAQPQPLPPALSQPSQPQTPPTTLLRAAAPTHGRQVLRGGSPKGLISLDPSVVPLSASSSPLASSASSPAITPPGTAVGKRPSPKGSTSSWYQSPTKHDSPRFGRRGGGGGTRTTSPYKLPGPHADISPLRAAAAHQKSTQRSPRGGTNSTLTNLTPVKIPRGRPKVKLATATTSPVKRVSSKTKGRTPMAGGTGLFELSIQASPYGVQTRQPRGIRYA